MKKAVGYLIPFMEEERQKRLAGDQSGDDKSLKVILKVSTVYTITLNNNNIEEQ